MGVERSVTLQFRDANYSSSDSTHSYDTPYINSTITSGYQDPEMLADILGTLQTTSLNNNCNISNNSNKNSTISSITFDCDDSDASKIQTAGLMTSTTNKSNNKTSSTNCFISCSDSCNILVTDSPINGQIMNLNNRGSSNSNSSSSSSSNSSSNYSNNSNEILTNLSVPGLNPPIVKKLRSKTTSPTRHGPQQCQICSKVFGNASALAKHKLTHSDERKYVCVMCSKAFKRQDHLNGHMMTHRNKKPYECKAEGCGKSYCDARSLRRHTENHHSAMLVTPTVSDAATPVNHSLSNSAVTPSGLSLSPATASGDASSPDGATCIRTYLATDNVDVGGLNYVKSSNLSTNNTTGLTTSITSLCNIPSVSLSSPVSSPGSDGIMGQQLDLISQIMHQSKQSNAQATTSALKIDASHSTTIRQKKLQHQHPSPNSHRPRTWNMQTQMHQTNSSKIAVTLSSETEIADADESGINDDLINIVQQQQKQLVTSIHPHILNIVKIDQKPVECNLCHRKFKNVPALNGHMRLHGGYFKKDIESKKSEKKDTGAPPLQTASIGVRALIEEKIISKRCKDLKGAFVVPAPPPAHLNAVRRIGLDSFLTAAKSPCDGETPAIFKSISNNGGLSVEPQHIDIFKRHQSVQKSTNVSVGTSTTSKSTSTDPKDSTLIELLKRGTKIAVARRSSGTIEPRRQSGTSNTTLMVPSDLSSLSNTVMPTSAQTTLINQNQLLATSLTNAETKPLSLTISQTSNGSGDIYTLTYSTDAATLFDENGIYSVSDTEMLLQTVNSIQLLNDTGSGNAAPSHIEQPNHQHSSEGRSSTKTVKDLRTLLNSPVPDSLTDFQTLHSKDLILYNNSGSRVEPSMSPGVTTKQPPPSSATSSTSPMLSPLAYPTPPASHETATQSSPFIDESHHFPDSGSSFFNEKCSDDFLEDSAAENFFKNTTTSHNSHGVKVPKLRNVPLKDNSFDSSVKVEDLLNESNDGECDLKDFAEQNLSFLNDDQGFLDDSRNPTSPLSESFFTSGIGTAEEVKEVLRDVLSDESINCESLPENVIDLYYLPGLGLQSQMMSNSEDPLLSSSPKDFINHKGGQTLQLHQQRQQLQPQIFEQPMKTEKQISSFNSFHPSDTSTSTCVAANCREDLLPALLTTSPNNDHISQSSFLVHPRPHPQSPTQSQQFCSQNNSSLTKTENVDVQIENKSELLEKSTQLQFNNGDNNIISTSESPISVNLTNEIVQNYIQNPVAQQPFSRLHPIHTNSILKKRLRASGTSDFTVNIKQTSYISKLRKPSRTHYTPQPMLDPNRKGVGLYSNLQKINQTSGTNKNSLNELDNDFENSVGLVAFSEESKVNLGSAYQVQVPVYQVPMEICTETTENDPNNTLGELMWNPSVEIEEKLLIRYIELSKSSAIPLGFHSEEVALQALLNANGDTHTAVLSLLQSQADSFQLKWSSLEVLLFLRGLEKYGKDFYTIANEITTKSTGECVQLYYFWKKLCVDYKETHLKVGVHTNECSQTPTTASLEPKPHMCEMPDCSASFSSKAALHGHKRIHCFGRNINQFTTSGSGLGGNTSQLQGHQNLKDDYPCKVCGKVFTKIKSRSAHMKSHRVQEGDSLTSHQ